MIKLPRNELLTIMTEDQSW